jgi:hypothetical protein
MPRQLAFKDCIAHFFFKQTHKALQYPLSLSVVACYIQRISNVSNKLRKILSVFLQTVRLCHQSSTSIVLFKMTIHISMRASACESVPASGFFMPPHMRTAQAGANKRRAGDRCLSSLPPQKASLDGIPPFGQRATQPESTRLMR